ncbi:snRNA-activating protein complex subunit 1-like isoform 3-T5 [Spinachia spinachia]
MPRMRPTFSDFFFTPLTEDVEELLARYQQSDSVRYEVFSAIWREMVFSDVFRGIVNVAEMKRFSRVALATAVKYFLPPYSYQIRVGGLYLMFALYHTQPGSPPVKLRLAVRDWPVVEKFVKDSGDFGHQDVVYVFSIYDKAFHYAAMPHFLTFHKQKKSKKQPVCAGFLGRTTAVQEFSSTEVLEEMTNIQGQYEMLKGATAEVRCNVTMTQPDFIARLRDCMSEFTTWQQRTFSEVKKEKSSDDEEEERQQQAEAEYSSSRAQLLSSIKQKSYGNFQEASKSRRHRQADTAESSCSGAEQAREAATRRRRRPPSLRARTRKSLGVSRDQCQLKAWLLSVPETREKSPVTS